MHKIVPSIASCNLMNVERELLKTEQSENIHVDIEDGNFVPNITFGMKFVNQLSQLTNKPFSVHLMVSNIDEYLEKLEKHNCSHIFIHAEESMYLRRSLLKAKKLNAKVGLALNPCSNIEDYEYVTDLLDSVLYMTSEPDEHGEKFIESMIPKIKKIDGKELWIDGGVTNEVIQKLEHVPVDYYVMGRKFFE